MKNLLNKKWIAVLLVLLLATASVFGAAATHTHDNIDFGTALTSNAGTLSDGNYYLASDTTLTTDITISGTVNICLNGHVLKGTGSGFVITILGSGTLNIYDCNGTELHYYTVGSHGLWTWNKDATSGTDFSSLTARPTTGAVIAVPGGAITGGNGGIYNNGTLTVTAGNIIGNTSIATPGGKYALGGGIYNSGTFTMTDGSVLGNAAYGSTGSSVDNWGGGIYSVKTVTITGGNISYNSISGDNNECFGYGGGIITNGSNSTVEISGAKIIGNSADYGGGIYNYSGTITKIENTNITYNTSIAGGGFYNYSGTITTIENTNITYNTADYGGGIYNNSGTITTIENTNITYNNTSECGGGIYNYGTLTLNADTKITNNTSTSSYPSAGVYAWFESGKTTITINDKVTIKDNTTTYNGKTIKANLCLSGETSNQLITIGSDALTGSEIGVTTMQNDVVGGYKFASDSNATTNASYFTSDNDIYEVKVDGNNLKLSEKPHTWTYSVDATAKTITATCTAAGCTAKQVVYLSPENSTELTVEVTDAGADNSVTWSSDKPEVAKVDSNGKVTAIGAGTATITATSTVDTTISGSIKITVTADPQ